MLLFAHETSGHAWNNTLWFALLAVSLVLGVLVWLGLSIIQRRYNTPRGEEKS